jgi:hypothetical protein
MLMEQLGCTHAEARRQLASLAADAGQSLAGLAAQITRLPEPAGDPGTHPDRGPVWPGLTWHAIDDARDGSALAAALLDDALTPAGAVAVALWLTEPDGGLQLAGQAGFGELEASRWHRIHPDMGGDWARSGERSGDLVAEGVARR